LARKKHPHSCRTQDAEKKGGRATGRLRRVNGLFLFSPRGAAAIFSVWAAKVGPGGQTGKPRAGSGVDPPQAGDPAVDLHISFGPEPPKSSAFLHRTTGLAGPVGSPTKIAIITGETLFWSSDKGRRNSCAGNPGAPGAKAARRDRRGEKLLEGKRVKFCDGVDFGHRGNFCVQTLAADAAAHKAPSRRSVNQPGPIEKIGPPGGLRTNLGSMVTGFAARPQDNSVRGRGRETRTRRFCQCGHQPKGIRGRARMRPACLPSAPLVRRDWCTIGKRCQTVFPPPCVDADRQIRGSAAALLKL